jgi:PTS system fructose IIA component
MSNASQQPSSQSLDMRKVSGVIVTHGHLAGELLAAAEMIVGPISHIAAVSIGWHDDVDAARDEVQRAITRVSQGGGVLHSLICLVAHQPISLQCFWRRAQSKW